MKLHTRKDEFEEDEIVDYEVNEKDEHDIYEEEGILHEVEQDELHDYEAGLMEGYEEISSLRCANCGKELGPDDKLFEKHVRLQDGSYETLFFCSEECAREYEENMEEESFEE